MPWTKSTPPVRATACAATAHYVGRPYAYQESRYDADSRLLEQASHAADGALLSVETHTWSHGHEVRRRETNVQEASWYEWEWVRDARDRLTRITLTSSKWTGVRTLSEYFYNEQGRLARIEHAAEENPVTRYTYDARGRVESILTEPVCRRFDETCERFTYWPNGQLRTAHRYTDFFWDITEQYDESGRLTHTSWGDFDAAGSTTRTYDEAGRLTRLWEKSGIRANESEAITTRVYDSTGLLLLERVATDSLQRSPEADPDPAQEVFTQRRITHRVTYLCGTRIVWLDEWDSNEDGVPDAHRTHERDDQGRLVHEQYSGTPGMDDGPVLRDFSYDCPGGPPVK